MTKTPETLFAVGLTKPKRGDIKMHEYDVLSSPIKRCDGYMFDNIDTPSQDSIVRGIASFLGIPVAGAESIAKTLYYEPYYNEKEEMMVRYRISVYIRRICSM